MLVRKRRRLDWHLRQEDEECRLLAVVTGEHTHRHVSPSCFEVRYLLAWPAKGDGDHSGKIQLHDTTVRARQAEPSCSSVVGGHTGHVWNTGCDDDPSRRWRAPSAVDLPQRPTGLL